MKTLEGVRVVEVGTAVAAPLCSLLLSEMGAEVVKVENTERGDDARQMGRQVKGESLYFFHYNKNKKSIAVDIKTEKGREIIKQLVKTSDVFVENFRPGVMDRLGLSYAELRKVNKRLVYCSVSGFGQTGPYSEFGGYDIVVQAMSGLMSVTGLPEGEPLRVGVPIVDILAAVNAAAAVCSALYMRERTGEGMYIDLSLFEAGVAAMGQWISTYVGSGELPARHGNKYPAIAPYELFKASDGWFVVAVGNEKHWRLLCSALGREDLLNDPRFSDNQRRTQLVNRDVLSRELDKTFSTKCVGEWVELLHRFGVPCGPVYTVRELLEDPHVKARNLLSEVVHPVLGRTTVVRSAPFYSGEKPSFTPPPLHGEHTEEVLKKLGCSGEEVEELERLGVVKRHKSVFDKQ
ncbi:MAG: CoA transferase [Candidatus Caldarchaeum sp.]|nr:CoA transferase [Candidatus Caldarchaeum sp.]